MVPTLQPARLHYALLVISVLLVFGQTVTHDFVHWDDDGYFLDHPQVRQGLTWDNVLWAFSSFSMANWHPLSWLSMMADVSLFGLWAGGHHLTGVAWHAVNTLLLYHVLVSLFGDRSRAFLVALLFAIHPLHVESVAWASERKDLVCAFFVFASLRAWQHYAAAPGIARYLLVAVCLAAALMAKPMAVSVPLLLLFLDYWPLRRATRYGFWFLIAEKIPLGLLSIASAAITLLAQAEGGATRSLEQIGAFDRARDVIVGYATYLAKTFVPTDLSFFYVRYPVGTGAFIASVLLLAGLAALGRSLSRHTPMFTLGLLWFLVTLLPVIGIVPVGDQAWANRYSYLPLIGIFMAVVWLLPIPGPRPKTLWQRTLLGAWLIAVPGLMVAAMTETHHWRSSEALFTRALQVNPDNHVAHAQLAEVYVGHGQSVMALEATTAALRSAPDGSPIRAAALVTRSKALMFLQRYDEAQEVLGEAAAIQPGHAVVHYNLGTLALLRKEYDGALQHLQKAVALKPDYSEAHSNRGIALLYLGDTAAAREAQELAIRLDPDNDDARYNLASVLLRLGRARAARDALEALANRSPNHLPARLKAARLADAAGERETAAYWARQALVLDPANPTAQRLLRENNKP